MSDDIRSFDDKKLVITKVSEHEFYMTLDQVANALEVNENTIMMQLNRNASEYQENVHWGTITYRDSMGRSRDKRILYKRGVIRISMFIRSEVAKRFRQWVEDLVIDLSTGEKYIGTPGMSSLLQLKEQMIQQQQILEHIIEQEQRHFELSSRVDVIEMKFDNRIDEVEEQLRNGPIDSAQAYYIKKIIDEIVRYTALKNGNSNPDKKQWSSVYGQFKHRFEISKYDQLARKDFDVALRFLVNWRDNLKDKIN